MKLNKFEKELEDAMHITSTEMSQLEARTAAIVALKYIHKAFEAGVKRGYAPDSNPDVSEWLREQKLL